MWMFIQFDFQLNNYISVHFVEIFLKETECQVSADSVEKNFIAVVLNC